MTSYTPYSEMSDDVLREALIQWIKYVEAATGWASAYAAAKEVEAIVRIGNQRGLAFKNPYPIRVG